MSAAMKKPISLTPRKVVIDDLIKHLEKPLNVPFGAPRSDGTYPYSVDLVYNPGLLTNDMLQVTTSDEDIAAIYQNIVATLCGIVTAWDLEDKEGAIPVGAEQEKEVSRRGRLGVLRRVFDAIVADNMPDPTSAPKR